MNKKVVFAQKLSALRKENNLKLKDFKEAGITSSMFTYYVSEKTEPKLSTLVNLSEMFEISLDELVFGSADDGVENNKSESILSEMEKLKKVISAQREQISILEKLAKLRS